MFGTIRRHNKLLWWIVVPAMIVSLFWIFMPNLRNSGQILSGSHGDFGSVNGEPITPDQLHDAEQEARIFFRTRYGEWPDSAERKKDVEQYARTRLVLKSMLADYHISVTSEAAARITRAMLGIKPADNVPVDKIIEALTKLGREGGVTLDDFDRYARDEAGQEYLLALVGMSGKLITPGEASVFFEHENQMLQTKIVQFPASNYLAMVKPTEKEISDFYTRREAEYRVPDRIQVNYIVFYASNYLNDARSQLSTNLERYVDQQYAQAGPAAFVDDAGKVLPADAAKAKLRKAFLDQVAMTDARKDANAFIVNLGKGHDDAHPFTSGDLAALAKFNHPVQTTEPFSADNPPKELSLPEKSIRVLFSLRDDDPDDKMRAMLYAPSALIGEDAVYVVGLQRRIPSSVQPLAAVHDKVVADYRRAKALELAKAQGAKFEDALTAGLSQGKTFETMCAAQFVQPKTLPPFNLMTTSVPDVDRMTFEQAQEIAGKMQPGQVTPFVPNADGGFVLYLKSVTPVDKATVDNELPGYIERMRQRLSFAAFNAWFSQQFQQRFKPPPNDQTAAGT